MRVSFLSLTSTQSPTLLVWSMVKGGSTSAASFFP
jgi:hypothetical protein